jgi:hypothetical protein
VPNYPTSLDSLANPTPTTLRNDPGFSLAGQIATLNDIVEAIQAKLGIGASTPGAAAGLLRRTAAGASAWGRAVDADVADAGTANIAINKLAHVGTGNVLRSDGTQNVAGKVIGADIAPNTIVGGNIAATTIVGGNLVAGTITTNEILDGTILTTDLVANAASAQQGAVGSTSDPATTAGSGNPTDLPQMALTVPMTVGQPVLLIFETGASNSVVPNVTCFDLYVAGAFSQRRQITCKVANAIETVMVVLLYTPLSTAATDVRVRFWVTGGTGTASGAGRTLTALTFKR